MRSVSSQVVYAIGSTQHSYVKVGTTANLAARLSALQTSSPFPLHVIWQHAGGHDLEAFLHSLLKGSHAHGEWFDFQGADPAVVLGEHVEQYRPPAAMRDKVPALAVPPDSDMGVLVAELRAVSDPGLRGELATELLDEIRDFNPAASQIRQAAAKALKDQGLTYKEIGERFGPQGRPLHFSRVRQIIQGQATGRWSRVARDENAAKDAANGADTLPES